MDKAPTASEALEIIGEAIYGSGWKGPLAERLGVSDRVMRRWSTGQIEVTFDHGIFGDLRGVIVEERVAAEQRLNALWKADQLIADNR